MVRRKKIETDSSIKTGNDELSMVTEIETAPENLSADELEKEFPIMTLRNMVMFPSVVMPVTAGRRTTLKLVHDAMKDKRHIIIATQKVAEVEDPEYQTCILLLLSDAYYAYSKCLVETQLSSFRQATSRYILMKQQVHAPT